VSRCVHISLLTYLLTYLIFLRTFDHTRRRIKDSKLQKDNVLARYSVGVVGTGDTAAAVASTLITYCAYHALTMQPLMPA